MGGNRFTKIRTSFSNNEILYLIIKYFSLDNKLTSLFDNEKIFSSIHAWRHHFARNGMDEISINKFMYMIYVYSNDSPICNCCKSVLSIEEFLILGISREKSFSKYCKSCTKDYCWGVRKNNLHDFSKRDKNISESKIKFYQTEYGKSVAKLISKNASLQMMGKSRSKETRQKQSIKLKAKIASGEFTPYVHNYYTKWDATYTIDNITYKFRSSWELCFSFCNQELKYEFFRFKYFEENNERTYISDFYDINNNIIYEIKPTSYFIKQYDKMNSVIKYCLDNNIKFIWINEFNITEYIDIHLLESSDNESVMKNWNKLKGAINAATNQNQKNH